MIGVGLLLLALGCTVAGWLLLRRTGAGWRIGRLLAAAPRRTLAEARALAGAGETAYIRVHGRVDSAEEFPGERGQPLVYRRRRLQRRAGRSGWVTFDDERLAVPFGLSERGERVAIDIEALGDGLVVVPRISEGTASELPAEVAGEPFPPLAPDTPVRLRMEQIAAVDHATAAGVPRLADPDGVVLGPGLGRPLLLTNLEPDEAMRVLAAGYRRGLQVAAGLFVAAPLAAVLGLIALLADR